MHPLFTGEKKGLCALVSHLNSILSRAEEFQRYNLHRPILTVAIQMLCEKKKHLRKKPKSCESPNNSSGLNKDIKTQSSDSLGI